MAKAKTNKTDKITRRAILTGSGAAIAAYAASTSLAENRDGRSPAAEIPDFASYRALALFLTFTTNPDFFDNAGRMDSAIAQRLGLTQDVVASARKIILSSPRHVNYDDVRADFQAIATAAFYSGGHCPSTPGTLGLIARLYMP